MARVTPKVPLESLHGSCGKSSPVYFRKQHNCTVLCAKPGATVDMILGAVPYQAPKRVASPAQQAARERFKALSAEVQRIMNDPEERARYTEMFKRDRGRSATTLRGYVMKRLMQK